MNRILSEIIALVVLATLITPEVLAQRTPKDFRNSGPKFGPSKAARDPSKTAETPGDFFAFPAVGVKLRQPRGFEKAPTWEGFLQKETSSSVMAISLPGPYSEVSSGFTKEKLASRQMKMLEKQDIKVGELPGVIVHFEQSAQGINFEKWSVIFGNENTTTMVTATFPKSKAAELSAPLKLVVLSVQPDNTVAADPTANVPFTMIPAGKLKPAQRQMTRGLMYSIDGSFPVTSPADPFFIAVESLGNLASPNKRQSAEDRLRALANVKNPVIRSTVPITIDGLEGFESIADAEDNKSATPIAVYQVMLFGEKSYILLVGMVGNEQSNEFLPAFKTMALSLKRKQP